MSLKVALVRYEKCHPEKCEDGVCVAAASCPYKLLRQEAPYEMPIPHPSLCRDCGECVRACPLEAIHIVTL